VKIATYNVNGIAGRLPILLRWLEEAEPDVVALQELKAPDEKFPAEALRGLGYEAVWYGQSRWNGVALLSRVGTIHETRRGLPGDPDASQSRYLEAAIRAGPTRCARCTPTRRSIPSGTIFGTPSPATPVSGSITSC